jgi:pimeloyl-ACP methyl ester carboxylesterase
MEGDSTNPLIARSTWKELMQQPNPAIEESALVEANGIDLHVRMAGTGYPLILLHGWPQTSYCWRKLIPLLATHFRVIAPDLRGFGDSEKPEGPYDKRTVATDILEMARSLGYDHALVAGHDIGGRVAYRLTLDHPQFVTGLISVAGRYSPLGEDLLFSKQQSRERWYFFFHQIAELPEALLSGRERIYLEHLVAIGLIAQTVAESHSAVTLKEVGLSVDRLEAMLPGLPVAQQHSGNSLAMEGLLPEMF